jgi:rSAM/selenodomain-associated transferase 1
MRRLALFAKTPVEGQVKTRLSPALPARLARDLHAAMLADAFELLRASSADERWVFWTGDGPRDRPSPAAGSLLHEQRGADLGARLEAAFAELLGQPGARAIVMGADCPDLDAAVIERAFAALEQADAVIGPAADGGYYLIGLSRPAPEVFRGIDWSTGAVHAQTLARAEAAGRRVASLATLADIDTPGDLAAWIGRRAVEPQAAPRAFATALAEMGLLPRSS